jgi:hypothetical protein
VNKRVHGRAHHLALVEPIVTTYLVQSISIFSIIVSLIILMTNYYKILDLDRLSKLMDVILKSLALIAGLLWAGNRYFVLRTDMPQLRVDADVKLVRNVPTLGSEGQPALLIYRLDIVNTGKTLLHLLNEHVEIDAVYAGMEECRYECLYRWPVEGEHPGGLIEPGSWSAINDVLSCSSVIQVVRVYIKLQLAGGDDWTWHRTFAV